ncbi:MAG: TauD/TfdA family dioxygenase, partial [Proteobacteria bacterium]|nr:TauD/TfdA family dioxygenase [Pseudomonadota bacterium]
MADITVTPLHPSIGAEVPGIDLAGLIDAPTRAALGRALAEHLVLVFRDQAFTPETYLAAATVFGPPMRQHYSQTHMPEFPDIGVVRHRDGQRPADMWHTDHTNRERPPLATMLYGVEVPSQGGGTSIANMRAAYAALPADEQARLAGMRTVNSIDRDRSDVRVDDRAKYGVPISHPMVRTHPVHGSRALYFHITKAQYIEGMSPAASQACLAGLLERTIRPEIVYHHV